MIKLFNQKQPAPESDEEEEDSDEDLFGSDDEDDEEAERVKAERVAAYNARKSKKPAVVAKSSILLDIKPVSISTWPCRKESTVCVVRFYLLVTRGLRP